MWIFDKKYIDMLNKHSNKYCGRCSYYNGDDCCFNISTNYFSICNKFKWSKQMIDDIKRQEKASKFKNKTSWKIRY